MHARSKIAGVAMIAAVFVLSSLYGPATSTAVTLENQVASIASGLAPVRGTSPDVATSHGFSFVSNFENKQLDGWTSISGAAPRVGYSGNTNYSGEPDLTSSASRGPQQDYATSGFVTGESFLSMQVAINAGASGEGYFGFATAAHQFAAVVGVDRGEVVAGPYLSMMTSIEPVPTNTAQPTGWVYLVANIEMNGTSSTMQVFVDSTETIAATVTVPYAPSYGEVDLETVHATVHYSDIIASTYQLAIYIPRYNNMEGYGQGSGLVVTKLPEFDNLTATMTLDSWSAPQNGILSFQINAMNFTGTTKSTCRGFFQLGLSIDKGGKISPWYVPGKNCDSTNFVSPVATPAGSVLTLSIVWEKASNQILFQIIDHSIDVTWSHAIPYPVGGGFYGAYTQMEFQPCCNQAPITAYKLSGSLTDLEITQIGGSTELLPASYMLPFTLDAPPSWYMEHYQGLDAGYYEIST